jgi:hypothetical protein
MKKVRGSGNLLANMKHMTRGTAMILSKQCRRPSTFIGVEKEGAYASLVLFAEVEGPDRIAIIDRLRHTIDDRLAGSSRKDSLWWENQEKVRTRSTNEVKARLRKLGANPDWVHKHPLNQAHRIIRLGQKNIGILREIQLPLFLGITNAPPRPRLLVFTKEHGDSSIMGELTIWPGQTPPCDFIFNGIPEAQSYDDARRRLAFAGFFATDIDKAIHLLRRIIEDRLNGEEER